MRNLLASVAALVLAGAAHAMTPLEIIRMEAAIGEAPTVEEVTRRSEERHVGKEC